MARSFDQPSPPLHHLLRRATEAFEISVGEARPSRWDGREAALVVTGLEGQPAMLEARCHGGSRLHAATKAGVVGVGLVLLGLASAALDGDVARRLWDVSERLTGTSWPLDSASA